LLNEDKTKIDVCNNLHRAEYSEPLKGLDQSADQFLLNIDTDNPFLLSARPAIKYVLQDESPYMLMVGPVKESHRRQEAEAKSQGKEGIDLLNVVRSDIPAVTHVDYSARVQTISEDRNGMFFHVLDNFYKKTGCPVLINTSFNIRGEPIVNTIEDAYRCFMCTDMDVLVLQNCVLIKDKQPPMAGADEYKKKYHP
jgi:carbamoyltransferase